MHFKLAREASVLSTRSRGAALTGKVESAFDDPAAKVVLDFEGVRFISHSFAHEFLSAVIGHARYKGAEPLTLINLNPSVESTVRDSLSSRQLAAVRTVSDPMIS